MTLWQKIGETVGGKEWPAVVRRVVISILVGVVAGLGAMAFSLLLGLMEGIFFFELGNTLAGKTVVVQAGELGAMVRDRSLMLILVPVLGGLLTGFLVYSLAPEAEGHGTDAVIHAYHNRRGIIRPLVPIVKIIASSLTIGSGGSAGREGPIAQIGAGFGSFVGRYLRLPERERRVLVLAGAGAGIGAIFRAPLGGAIFAIAVLYRDVEFEHEALLSCFIASITGYSVYCSLAKKFGPIFELPEIGMVVPAQLPFFVLLGLVVVPIGILYIKVFYKMRDWFKALPITPHLKPAIGGLGIGLLGFAFPAIMGGGYGWLQRAIEGNLTLWFMVTFVFLKIIATSFTISSGGSGGVFAPSLTIGGMIGGALWFLLHTVNPGLGVEPGAFVLVGMAAFFSGAAKVPLAALVLVSEMTMGYELLVPSMLAITVAFIINSRRLSIYEKQVMGRLDSPAHRGEYAVNVLEEMSVKEAMAETDGVETVGTEAPLAQVIQVVAKGRQSIIPVVDTEKKLRGFITANILQEITPDEVMEHLIIAEDIMETRIGALRPEQDLRVAMESFLSNELDELPVVDKEGKVLGVINRRQVLVAYYHRMRRLLRTREGRLGRG